MCNILSLSCDSFVFVLLSWHIMNTTLCVVLWSLLYYMLSVYTWGHFRTYVYTSQWRLRIRQDRGVTQTQVICYEVRATALRPRLHHREGFLLNPQREFSHRNLYTQGDYNWSTQDRSTQLPPIQPLHKLDHNTRKDKSLGDQKDHKLSLTTSYRVEMIFGSKSKVRKFQS